MDQHVAIAVATEACVATRLKDSLRLEADDALSKRVGRLEDDGQRVGTVRGELMDRDGAAGGAGGRLPVGRTPGAVPATADLIDLLGEVIDLVPAALRGLAAQMRAQIRLHAPPRRRAAGGAGGGGGGDGQLAAAGHPSEVDCAAALEQHDRVLDELNLQHDRIDWKSKQRGAYSEGLYPRWGRGGQGQHAKRFSHPVHVQALLLEGLKVGKVGAGPGKVLAASLEELREDLHPSKPGQRRNERRRMLVCFLTIAQPTGQVSGTSSPLTQLRPPSSQQASSTSAK